MYESFSRKHFLVDGFPIFPTFFPKLLPLSVYSLYCQKKEKRLSFFAPTSFSEIIELADLGQEIWQKLLQELRTATPVHAFTNTI